MHLSEPTMAPPTFCMQLHPGTSTTTPTHSDFLQHHQCPTSHEAIDGCSSAPDASKPAYSCIEHHSPTPILIIDYALPPPPSAPLSLVPTPTIARQADQLRFALCPPTTCPRQNTLCLHPSCRLYTAPSPSSPPEPACRLTPRSFRPLPRPYPNPVDMPRRSQDGSRTNDP
jgi:hypothetical protein